MLKHQEGVEQGKGSREEMETLGLSFFSLRTEESYFHSKCAVKLKSVRRQMGLFQPLTYSPAVLSPSSIRQI